MSASLNANASLDAADWRLLHQLQRDASLNNQELAARCHLSPATCLRRVRRLRALGLIERTVCVLDASAMRWYTGAGLTAIEKKKGCRGILFCAEAGVTAAIHRLAAVPAPCVRRSFPR